MAPRALPTFLAGVDLGTQPTRYLELRFSVFAGVTRPELHSSVPLIEDERAARVGGARPHAYFDPSGLLVSGSAFFAFDSPIGPIYLGYGVAPAGTRAPISFRDVRE